MTQDQSPSIESLNVSVMATNALKSGGIKTIGQLMQMTTEDLLKISGIGKKSYNEIMVAAGLADKNQAIAKKQAKVVIKDKQPAKENKMQAPITLISTAPIAPALTDGQGACTYLAIGRTHLHALMREGRLVPVRLGKSVRFRILDLDRLIAESMTADAE